jgi:phage replication O-like protein O
MNPNTYDNIHYNSCQELETKLANIKLQSSVNPQADPTHGYVRISNEVYDSLLKYHFKSGYTAIIFLAIIRKTWGWQKKCDAISISQLIDITNFKELAIVRSLDELKNLNMIFVSKRSYKNTNTYAINKHYDTWANY